MIIQDLNMNLKKINNLDKKSLRKQAIVELKFLENVINCKHSFKLFNEYYKLYYCDFCRGYFTLLSYYKDEVLYSYTDVTFSDNDDRIIAVWCYDLQNYKLKGELNFPKQFHKNFLKMMKPTKEEIAWKKKCAKMYDVKR